MPVNTEWIARMQYEEVLKLYSKQDLKQKLKEEHGLIVPAHSPKKRLIEALLEARFGKETQDEKSTAT
jgi:hypothetical protein